MDDSEDLENLLVDEHLPTVITAVPLNVWTLLRVYISTMVSLSPGNAIGLQCVWQGIRS